MTKIQIMSANLGTCSGKEVGEAIEDEKLSKQEKQSQQESPFRPMCKSETVVRVF